MTLCGRWQRKEKKKSEWIFVNAHLNNCTRKMYDATVEICFLHWLIFVIIIYFIGTQLTLL